MCICRETPLRSFLQASMLSSEGDNDDGSKEVGSKKYLDLLVLGANLLVPSVESDAIDLPCGQRARMARCDGSSR